MILKLSKPIYLKISNSFLSINFIKNICVDIKKIKGSISKTIEGEFKNDKKVIEKKLNSISLKNSTCSKIFVIKIIAKKTKKTLKKETLKRLIKNFI